MIRVFFHDETCFLVDEIFIRGFGILFVEPPAVCRSCRDVVIIRA